MEKYQCDYFTTLYFDGFVVYSTIYMQVNLTRIVFLCALLTYFQWNRTKLLSNYKDFLIHFYSDL